MQARSLEDCLTADSAMARLAGHAARLLHLQRIFEAAVPRTLLRSTRVANLKLGKLVLHADNAAAAAKIRQIVPTLVNVFRDKAAEVTGIEIKVQPRPAPSRPPAAAMRDLPGTQAKQGLTSLAGKLPPDSPLREALQRLLARS